MQSTFGNSLLLLITLFFLGASPMRPDSLSGGTPASWNPNFLYSLPTYIPGLYYWNNNSGDGPKDNIGWCLVGSASCGMQNPPGDLRYYASSSPASGPANMYFTSNGGSFTATLALSLTDQKGLGHGLDLFGFYLTDATGTAVMDPTVIFTSNDAIGNQYTLPAGALTAGENYGFFIENVQGLGTPYVTYYIYYLDSALNVSTGPMPADNMQHFAIFSTGSTYYIGGVDGDECSGSFQPGVTPCITASQFDYNDMVVELSTSSGAAPEPGSASLSGIGMLGAGLLGAAFGLRRKIVR